MPAKRIRDFEEKVILADTDELIVDRLDGSFKAKISTVLGHTHDHAIGDVTDLTTELGTITTAIGTKAATNHQHTVSAVTDFTTASETLIDNNLQEAQVIENYWQMMGVTYKRNDLGSVSGTVAINLSLAMYHTMTITGATTLSFTNVKSGSLVSNIGLKLINAGTNITWPASVKWPDATPVELTTTGTDILNFISDDNGTTWYNIGQVLNIG